MPVIIDGTLGVNAAAVTTTSWNPTNLVIPGNSTIGDGTSDTFVVNAGSLNFNQSAQRITGDFSNGTAANRVSVQSSTANGATLFNLIPNGSSATSTYYAWGGSDTANAPVLLVGQTTVAATINSTKTGTGAYTDLAITTGGIERLRIGSGGGVTIGSTTTTDSKFMVVGPTGQTAFTGTTYGTTLLRAASANGEYTNLDFSSTGAYPTARIGMLYTGAGSYLQFGTSNSYASGITNTAMTIDYNGNTGVGTGSSALTSRLTVQRSAVSSIGIALTLNNPYGYGAGVGTAAVGIRFARSPNDTGSTGIMADIFGGNSDETTSTGGFLAFATRTGVPEATTERMRITADGKIGIGTPIPTQKLHVSDGSLLVTNGGITLDGSGADVNFYRHSTDGYPMALILGKRRGTPGASSEVANGDGLGTLFFVGKSSSGDVYPAFISSAVNGAVSAGTVPADLIFGAGSTSYGTERMRIKSNGYVGIGTNSPVKTLDVRGSAVFGDGTLPSTQTSIENWTSAAWSNASTTVGAYAGASGSQIAIRAFDGSTQLYSNARVDLSYGQLRFPGAQNSSSDGNTLDDYEEGSWSPTSLTAGVTISAVHNAHYTKIGRMVHAFCYMTVNNTNGAGVAWNCGGLPFSNGAGYPPATRYYGSVVFAGVCYVEGGSTFIIDSNGLAAGSTSLMLSATYFTN